MMKMITRSITGIDVEASSRLPMGSRGLPMIKKTATMMPGAATSALRPEHNEKQICRQELEGWLRYHVTKRNYILVFVD